MKNFLRGAVAVVVAIAIVICASRILILKSEDGISQLESLYKQKKDSIDVLFLGSSRIYCNVRTGVLWDEYGISAYDLGGAEAPSWSSYYHLKEALKTQHPKVVVYEISVAAVRPTLYPPIFWVQDNVYGMKWNANRIEAMKIQVFEENFKKGLVPLSAMHDRYKELSKNDFVDENNSINYKGFDEREGVVEYETPDVTSVTERIPISEKAEEYTRKIIDVCEEAGIPLIFIVAPYYPSDEEQAMYNYTMDIADERGVEHIDFNACYMDYGMDYSTDMVDEFHLNTSGSIKFSQHLGKILKEKFALEDHRGDEKYASWDVDASLQRQQIQEVQINAAQTDGDYFLNLLSDKYITYISLGYGAERSSTIYNNRTVLKRLGLKPEYYLTDGIFIMSDGEAIYGSIDATQKAHVEDGDINLLLVRNPGETDRPVTTLYIDHTKYDLSTDGIKVLVYDKVLNRVVSEKEFPI